MGVECVLVIDVAHRPGSTDFVEKIVLRADHAGQQDNLEVVRRERVPHAAHMDGSHTALELTDVPAAIHFRVLLNLLIGSGEVGQRTHRKDRQGVLAGGVTHLLGQESGGILAAEQRQLGQAEIQERLVGSGLDEELGLVTEVFREFIVALWLRIGEEGHLNVVSTGRQGLQPTKRQLNTECEGFAGRMDVTVFVFHLIDLHRAMGFATTGVNGD